MSAWFAASWLLGMIALTSWIAHSVGAGTNPRERAKESTRRMERK